MRKSGFLTASVMGVLALPNLAQAAAGYTLPSSGATGVLGSIETKMIEIANFASSTGGVMLCLLSILIAVGAWVLAPKSGALSVAMRAVTALIVVFNLTAWVTYFTFA